MPHFALLLVVSFLWLDTKHTFIDYTLEVRVTYIPNEQRISYLTSGLVRSQSRRYLWERTARELVGRVQNWYQLPEVHVTSEETSSDFLCHLIDAILNIYISDLHFGTSSHGPHWQNFRSSRLTHTRHILTGRYKPRDDGLRKTCPSVLVSGMSPTFKLSVTRLRIRAPTKINHSSVLLFQWYESIMLGLFILLALCNRMPNYFCPVISA